MSEKSRPFLKWAGNKYALVSRITELLPPGRRLVEPFVGAGAVFLNADYDEYLLGDVNEDLIALYGDVSRRTDELITAVKRLFVPDTNNRDTYNDLRVEFNNSPPSVRKSSIFLYLNRHCFNGLCRYNRSGKFNVPFGRYAAPYCPEKEIRRAAERLRRATIVAGDYRAVFASLRPGDVVYADPPYATLTDTAKFTSYSAGGFSDLDQQSLAEEARKAAANGVTVIVSNHDAPRVREWYADATISSFDVARFISCKVGARLPAREILAVFKPQAHSAAA